MIEPRAIGADVSGELGRALVLWQRAAGPYWAYVCAAPFVSGRAPPRPRKTRPDPRLRDLVLALAEPGTALFVDVAPAAALAVAPELSVRGVAVVPVVQRWCAPTGLLAARPLVDGLLDVGALARPRGAGIVLLLDGERAGRRGEQPPPHRFDNRYDYAACRFPPPALLEQEGVERVRWVGRGIAPDLRGYAAGLRAAGLDPLIVDPG